MQNILSVDVEDWFQVENYAAAIPRESWDAQQSRVERNCEKILALLDKERVQATFFVLGWIAERAPQLVSAISEMGHEIASHGWSHTPIWNLSRDEFREEINKSRGLLREITGQEVSGYRAPTFSIVQNTLWALEELADAGYNYDSSIFPIRHDRYGIPGAPATIHQVIPGLVEIPPSTVRVGKIRLPVAGGGYLRLYPRRITDLAISRINRLGAPAVVYIHPWEFDSEHQSDIKLGFLTGTRQHIGIAQNLDKLKWLLGRHRFSSVRSFLQSDAANAFLETAGQAHRTETSNE